MPQTLLVFVPLISACPSLREPEGFEIKGGVERDGVYFVAKDEKAKGAEIKVQK